MFHCQTPEGEQERREMKGKRVNLGQLFFLSFCMDY